MINLREANFHDKSLICVECHQTFIWSGGEQRYFAAKELSPPKRCPRCRLRRKLTLMPDPEVHNG